MMKRKPGRPRGTKNKIKPVVLIDKAKRVEPISDFQRTLDEWDRMEKQTSWEEIAKKLQIELSVYKDENDELAKICISRWEEIQHLKYLVSYLEKRIENAAI